MPIHSNSILNLYFRETTQIAQVGCTRTIVCNPDRICTSTLFIMEFAIQAPRNNWERKCHHHIPFRSQWNITFELAINSELWAKQGERYEEISPNAIQSRSERDNLVGCTRILVCIFGRICTSRLFIMEFAYQAPKNKQKQNVTNILAFRSHWSIPVNWHTTTVYCELNRVRDKNATANQSSIHKDLQNPWGKWNVAQDSAVT